MSSVNGGFSGDNALLAFAAMQQGRMNEELTESMRAADIRSQMAQDIASIKAHLDGANRDFAPNSEDKFVNAENFIELDKELKAFMEKYGDDPACADMMPAMEETVLSVATHVQEYRDDVAFAANGYALAKANWEKDGRPGVMSSPPNVLMPKYDDKNIQRMLDQMQQTLDAAGTNDQLAMIHIKQLNDNINNSSGMVSGIMESRQNATASIINNLA